MPLTGRLSTVEASCRCFNGFGLGIGINRINACLICSPLLIVKVIFVITVFFLFLLCVSTILVNKDDHLAAPHLRQVSMSQYWQFCI